ncbi:MAG: uncharacterized protein QOE92_227 [Chloroflexota bacterium]|jgi:putative membrane protein insertion efficiency factor|nr:uncharacterized protein [Chloroflexota bacterium]
MGRSVSLLLVRAWQATLSGRVGRCRFSPPCSEYAAEAISRYGAIKGWRMAAARVWRCAPGNPRGYDPLR